MKKIFLILLGVLISGAVQAEDSNSSAAFDFMRKMAQAQNEAQSKNENKDTGCTFKVAIVDLEAVVSNSRQVKALQEEQNDAGQKLKEWLQNAQNTVNGQNDEEKKNTLLQKYNAEFAQKREKLAEQYSQRLKEVDASITKSIADEAKKMGYTLVLVKGATVYGGDDITEDVKKVVK